MPKPVRMKGNVREILTQYVRLGNVSVIKLINWLVQIIVERILQVLARRYGGVVGSGDDAE